MKRNTNQQLVVIGAMVAALVAPSLCAASPLAAQLTLAPSSGTFPAGGVFTVELRVNPVDTSLAGVSVFLQYSTAVLQFSGGSTNRAVFNNSLITGDPAQKEAGIVSFSAGATAALPAQDALVATVTFNVLGSGPAALEFLTQSPRKTEGADTNFNPVALVATGGSYTFGGALPTDLNGNGAVDSDDLLLLIENWSPPGVAPGTPGDVDGDGDIDHADAMRLARDWRRTSGAAPTDTPTRTPTTPPAATDTPTRTNTPTPSNTPTSGTGGSAVLRLDPASGAFNAGNEFDVTVRLDPFGQPAAGVSVFLTFDGAKLAFVSGTTNTAVFNNSLITGDPAVKEPGVISFSAGATAAVGGSNVLVATIRLRALGGGAADVAFSTAAPRKSEVTDTDFNALPLVTQGASYTITGGTSPTATPTNTPIAGQNAVLRLDPASGAFNAGNEFDLTVRLDPFGQPAAGVSVFLTFDGAKLAFVSGTTNTAVFNNSLITGDPAVKEPGVISFSAGATAAVGGSNVLVATIRLRALGGGAADVAFSTTAPRKSEVTDTDFNALPLVTQGASYTIGGGASPTATPTNTPIAGQNAILRLDPASGAFNAGNEFDVEVRLDPFGQPAAGVSVFLTFDGAKLAFVSGTTNTAVFNNSLITGDPAVKEPGVISFSAGATAAVGGSNVLVATIWLRALGGGAADVAFSTTAPRKSEVTDTDFNALPLVTQGASYTIGGGASPTATPTNTTAPATSTPTHTVSSTSTPTATTGGTVAEQEPNDYWGFANDLGTVATGSAVTITGGCSSGGMVLDQYIGDIDIFRFTTTAQQDVSATLNWAAQADLDLFVLYDGEPQDGDHGTGKPVTLSGTISDGQFAVAVASKDNAAAYTLSLQVAASTAPYPNNPAILNGAFMDAEFLDLFYTYVFNGAGSYEIWVWTVLSGSVLLESGTYRIWYPYLVLNSGFTDRYSRLEFASQDAIYLDGNLYQRTTWP